MSYTLNDSGLILTKKDFLKDDKLVILFTERQGKISLIAKGVKTITSKRLAHLETGNFINFSYSQPSGHTVGYLQETDLQYAYSQIKNNTAKLNVLYHIFFVLNQLLPDSQSEVNIFKITQKFLKDLNNKDLKLQQQLLLYLKNILLAGGYIDEMQAEQEYFDPHKAIEELIQKKVNIPSF